MLCKILFFLFFVKISKSQKIICNGKNDIVLAENEIKFFESPNFPEIINEELKNNCTLSVKGLSKKPDMFLILVITNGYITGGNVNGRLIKQTDIYFFTYEPNLTFSFDDYKIRGHEAFQGFITYEQERFNSCVLAGRNKSFEFTNESEILYLRSNYRSLYETKYVTQRRCLWEFVAKDGYGIKVETLGINMQYENLGINLYPHLYIVTENTRDFIIGPTIIKYYPENKLAISYDDYDRSFEARISIFKIPQPPTLTNCLLSKDGIWTSPSNIEYKNKLQCNHTFEIQPYHELHINVNFVINETGNILKFYSDENTFFPVNITRNGNYVFLPFINNTVRRLTFEYKSDESVINKEFKIEFQSIECNCSASKIVVPCSGTHIYSILGRKDNYYCTDMKCNFTISMNETCPNRHIEFEANIENPNYDHLLVQSDADSLINAYYSPSNIESKRNHKVLILPGHSTKMFFESSYDTSLEYLGISTLTFKMISYERPNSEPDVIISDETPIFYNEQINKHSIVTIKLSKELLASNAKLEIIFDPSTFETKCLNFYENKNLTSIKTIEKSIETLGTSVSIYKYSSCLKDTSLFVIRAKKANSSDCRFTNTTLIANGRDTISMIAGTHSSCEIVLLNSAKANIIKYFYTNSKSEDVLLFNNANKTNALVRFNEKSSNLYSQITFNSRIYLISIPPNSSVFVKTEEEDSIKFTEPTLSFYETPKYGALYNIKNKEKTSYKISDGLEAIFTVVDFDISKNGYLQISQNSNSKNFTVLNEIFVANSVNGSKVTIYFEEPEAGYRGAILNITVKQNNRKTGTTKSTIKSTISSTIISREVEVTPTNTSNSYIVKFNEFLFFLFFTVIYCLFKKNNFN